MRSAARTSPAAIVSRTIPRERQPKAMLRPSDFGARTARALSRFLNRGADMTIARCIPARPVRNGRAAARNTEFPFLILSSRAQEVSRRRCYPPSNPPSRGRGARAARAEAMSDMRESKDSAYIRAGARDWGGKLKRVPSGSLNTRLTLQAPSGIREHYFRLSLAKRWTQCSRAATRMCCGPTRR